MSRLTRPVRLLTLVLAAIQFAVPAFLSVADGELAQAGRNSASHVEALGGSHCAPAHAADCALCRFLSTTSRRPAVPPAVAVETRVTRVGMDVPTAKGIAPPGHGFLSRAPPTLPG